MSYRELNGSTCGGGGGKRTSSNFFALTHFFACKGRRRIERLVGAPVKCFSIRDQPARKIGLLERSESRLLRSLSEFRSLSYNFLSSLRRRLS